jgi:hypothetical protein
MEHQFAMTGPCKAILEQLEIPVLKVAEALLEPDQFMELGSPSYRYLTRWFDDGSILFMCVFIERGEDERMVELAIELPHELPAGEMARGMEMEEILNMVAESFGLLVTAHPDENPAYLYEGPWDGDDLTVIAQEGDRALIMSAFNAEKNHCHMAWAFSLKRYMEWFRES